MNIGPSAAVTVVGAGSWGTALALQLARTGRAVRLWARDPHLAATLTTSRENPTYLKGILLPSNVEPTAVLEDAVRGAAVVVMAVPSEFAREAYRAAVPRLEAGAVLVSATKGIEVGTLHRMSEVAAAEAPAHPFAALSGPSFAWEVAREQPTTIVIASADAALAEALQHAVSTRAFRAYSSTDVVGVELAGALKNVIAIAAGIVDGLGLGQNTVAALVTRGLAEMTRLAVASGGRADTLSGLAGLGDLVLTCTGGLSRNRWLGQALGQGRSLAEARAGSPMVAEGVRTTIAACALAARAGVEMPIAVQMNAVLHEGKAPREAVEELMLRSLKRE